MTLQRMNDDEMAVRAEEEDLRLQSAEDAGALCTGLMETTAELIMVLERETSLMRKRKTDDLQALQLKKQVLTAALTRNLARLRANTDYIQMAVPQQVDQLKEQQRQFHKSLSANQDALNAMKAVSEQLIQLIAKKVGEQSGGPQTYGKGAEVTTAPPNQPAAISFDSTL